jgi:hypothetical protein
VRQLPHHRSVLVTALLAALLAGSAGLTPGAAAAAPKDKDARTAKATHGHRPAASARHDRAVVPATPHQHKQRPGAAASRRPAAVAPVLPPAPVATVVARVSSAALRPEPAAGSPFRRTTQPVRPLVRPSVVPRSTVLWRVHDPADRRLLRALQSTADHPTPPLLVAALVGLFLLVQHRIDRDDPKLSRGHRNDPADLRFGPVVAL